MLCTKRGLRSDGLQAFDAADQCGAEDLHLEPRDRPAPQGTAPEGSAGRATSSTLDALDRTGVRVLSSCRQGACGTCETPVLAG
ncbi:2Fe-2S iron-sulfur cluster-binding protein [Streptomyces sp. NBC_00056]|uniref:2Fe-2S iron-sulfur cluster-binding protein n=1 Tax=unclassified Streptomyces TaxID=2593676 RepID=UPI00224D0234|nr:2Fe-2S iron-sulfur cluster-binding protein [Streptomyces sp. NBC_00063]MCX5442208.1 2Fe-2S iron-sulfur cluster-binding protein [Streptomyces sp. NBC_00063]